MPGSIDNNRYFHIVSYSGFMIELSSTDRLLLKLDFVKKKKIKNSAAIPDTLKEALSFLDDYFSGRKNKTEICFVKSGEVLSRDHSGKLLLDMSDYTEKEINIYRNLLSVESGKTVSYSELASASGIKDGARFAGNCMAGNRFPIIIPCHRVIKKDGAMGNYTGGVEIKEFLLNHEKNLKEN